MNTIGLPYLTIPLGRDAHRLAEQFAAQQATLLKGKRVYLNTLAVYAVHCYLSWRQVETDLTQGDSWHSGLRTLFDVADLFLLGFGKLECRPVLPGETTFRLPPETIDDRIGYVAVQLNERLDQAQLLGFALAIASQDPPERMRVSELKPLDRFLDYIYSAHPAPPQQAQETVNLRQWLQGIFEQDWQSTERVMTQSFRNTTQLRLRSDSAKSSISRAKVIDLGTPLTNQKLVLVIQIIPTLSQETEICLRLYPSSDSMHLPPDLQLTVLDEAEAVCLETKARSTDNWIQMEFNALQEEQFIVRLVLGEICINERFII
jgi:hypothetical protein